MMNTIKIQTADCFRPEKEYAFHVLLREMLGLDYVVEYQTLESHILQIPNGAALTFLDKFTQLTQPQPYQLQFPPADPFFATFWMLTRLEEAHNPDVLDAHGRFPAAQSQAFKQGFLHRPVVNEWADELWEALVRLGWQGTRKTRKFQLSLSCDVDHPRLWWSAADRVRTLAGALFRRGDFSEASYWFKNHLFEKKDPYDVFEEWLEIFAQQNLIAQFNFMGARPRSSDCWYPLNHPFIGRLMAKITEKGHKIGFHPSYEAYDDQALFEHELASLRAVSPVEITAGRQHYLRFSAPKTWQMWESAGLLEDSTVGFAEAEGFRCGICHDYPVFDIKQRKMLQLREKPLIAMDVSLAQYRAYAPEQGLENLSQLLKTVERHQGDFTLLWHNSSWNTPFWENWKSVFRKFIATTCLALFCFVQTGALSASIYSPKKTRLGSLEPVNRVAFYLPLFI